MSLVSMLMLKEAMDRSRSSSSSSSSTSTDSGYSLFNNHMDEIDEDLSLLDNYIRENLKPFFDKLRKYNISKIDNIRELSTIKVNEYAKDYNDKVKDINDIKNKLSQKISITTDSSITLTVPVEVEEGHGFGGVGHFSYNHVNYGTSFNGVEITKQMLERNINPYRIQYLQWADNHVGLAAEIYELEKSIAKEIKGIHIFNKKEHDAFVASSIEKLKSMKEELNKGTQLKKKADTYDNLIPAYKDEIINYLTHLNDIVEDSNVYYQLINNSIQIDHRRYEEDNIKEVLANGIKDGVFTEDEINNIVQSLPKELHDKLMDILKNYPHRFEDWKYEHAFFKTMLEKEIEKEQEGPNKLL